MVVQVVVPDQMKMSEAEKRQREGEMRGESEGVVKRSVRKTQGLFFVKNQEKKMFPLSSNL